VLDAFAMLVIAASSGVGLLSGERALGESTGEVRDHTVLPASSR